MLRYSLILVLITACAANGKDTEGPPLQLVDGDADTDTDADADADADADTDSDADTDTDITDTGDTAAIDSCVPVKFTPALIETTPLNIGDEYVSHQDTVACIEPGVRMHGFHQVWYTRESDDAVYCLYTYEFDTTNVRADCADCDWAFELQWGVPYEDGTSLCSDWYNPIDMALGADVGFGFTELGTFGSPEVWWWAENSVWTPDNYQWGPFSPLEANFDGVEWEISYPLPTRVRSFPPP